MFNPANVLEAKETLCPDCRNVISLEDVNVAKDIALCRGCGKVWTFSLVRATKELAGVDLQNPPKGVRIEEDFQGGMRIRFHRISRSLIFLIPFTALWSGFSMWGIYGSQIRKGEFD